MLNDEEGAYRVLARKYRPMGFDDLIGQEHVVRTLTNAFALRRTAKAYLLTGVRGVGKTTTARILARAFNYETDEVDSPTVHMPTFGRHCRDIVDGRHLDVVEMDAASNTGTDDVREVVDSARFRPVRAREKVFVVDEVHMLSKQAFGALERALEDPPDHVRFLFATTEIEKVPVGVRGRCQRFDLRRVGHDAMVGHLARVCDTEGVAMPVESLALISRASEGSVRDALSLLDQAIARSAGSGQGVDEATLRDMLGLSDRTRVIDLFEHVMRGDVAAATTAFREMHDAGKEPGDLLAELAGFVHYVTRLKLVPDAASDPVASPEERSRGAAFAAGIKMASLTRAWKAVLEGMEQARRSPLPLASAEMALVRFSYGSDLPTPSEAVARLRR